MSRIRGADTARMLVFVVLLCCLLCCGAGGQEAALTLTLTVARAPAPGEAIRVRVSAGVLPHGARIIVRTADGKIAGAVAPYGIPPGSKAGVYTIPIPAQEVKDGKLSLSFELKDRYGSVRAPTRDEVEGAEVVLLPVSKPPNK